MTLFKNGEQQSRALPFPPPRPGAYLESFLSEVHGQRQDLHLSSAESLRAARIALLVQQAADRQQAHVPVPSSFG
jgi:hypothetical protein